MQFDGYHGTYTCCPAAELYLHQSLKEPLNPQSNQKRPVIIIGSANKPVAVIKNRGDITLYGLRNAPEQGILKGVFSEPSPSLLRFSAYSIPVIEGGKLKPIDPYYSLSFYTSNRAIFDRTIELAQAAIQLSGA